MTRQKALDQIEAAIATFSPAPLTQEALARIERALEQFEVRAYEDGWNDGLRSVAHD